MQVIAPHEIHAELTRLRADNAKYHDENRRLAAILKVPNVDTEGMLAVGKELVRLRDEIERLSVCVPAERDRLKAEVEILEASKRQSLKDWDAERVAANVRETELGAGILRLTAAYDELKRTAHEALHAIHRLKIGVRWEQNAEWFEDVTQKLSDALSRAALEGKPCP